MDVKKRLFMIGTLLLLALVTTLVMMEKYGFATFYEVRCELGRTPLCQPNGSVVLLERDFAAKRIVVEKFDFEGKRVDFAQGDECRIPDSQNFFCLKKSSVSLNVTPNGTRQVAEVMNWSMVAGKLLNQREPSTRAFYVDGFEFWRRRLLFGWNP